MYQNRIRVLAVVFLANMLIGCASKPNTNTTTVKDTPPAVKQVKPEEYHVVDIPKVGFNISLEMKFLSADSLGNIDSAGVVSATLKDNHNHAYPMKLTSSEVRDGKIHLLTEQFGDIQVHGNVGGVQILMTDSQLAKVRTYLKSASGEHRNGNH